MISIITILMNLLQNETEKYIFIDTCKFQRHRPRVMYATKDCSCPPPVIDAALWLCFLQLTGASRPSSMIFPFFYAVKTSEKAPEANDILQTRPGCLL